MWWYFGEMKETKRDGEHSKIFIFICTHVSFSESIPQEKRNRGALDSVPTSGPTFSFCPLPRICRNQRGCFTCLHMELDFIWCSGICHLHCTCRTSQAASRPESKSSVKPDPVVNQQMHRRSDLITGRRRSAMGLNARNSSALWKCCVKTQWLKYQFLLKL